MIRRDEELLGTKELAERLGRNESYVRAMKRGGFDMPGGRASLTEARRWLKSGRRDWGKRR